MRTRCVVINDLPLRLWAILVTTVLAAAFIFSFGCGSGADGTSLFESTESEPGVEGETLALTGGTYSSSIFTVDPRGWLRFDFNIPVDQASARANFLLTSTDGSPLPNVSKAEDGPADYLMEFRNSNRTLMVKAKRLPYCYEIAASFQGGMEAESGLALAETLNFQFVTMPDPHDIDGDCKADVIRGNPFHNNDIAQYNPIEDLLLGFIGEEKPKPIEPEFSISFGLAIDPPKPPPDLEKPMVPGCGPGITYVFPNSDVLGNAQTTFDLDKEIDQWSYEDPSYDLMGIASGKTIGDMNGDGLAEFSLLALDRIAGTLNSVVFCDMDDATPDVGTVGSVFPVGDVNGDGLADVVVNGVDENGAQSYGLHLGRAGCLSADPDIALPLDDGATGLFVAGIKNFNGDITDEGMPLEDFAIGTMGAVFVFLGSQDIADLGVPDTIIASGDADLFGLTVAGGGDVNGDGFDDLLVGAPAGLGRLFLEFMDSGVLEEMMFMGSISNPLEINPLMSVASKFVEYDGIETSEYAGRAYLFYGNDSPQMSSKADANVVYTGEMQELEGLGYIFGDVMGLFGLTEVKGLPDMFGSSLFIGELNGDGYADVMVGAPAAIQINPAATNLLEQGMMILALLEMSEEGEIGEFEALAGMIDIILNVVDGSGAAYFFEGGNALPTKVGFMNADAAYKARGRQYGLAGLMKPVGDVNNDGLDDFIMLDIALTELDLEEFTIDMGWRFGLFLGGDNVSGFNKDVDDADAIFRASIPEEVSGTAFQLGAMMIQQFLGEDEPEPM